MSRCCVPAGCGNLCWLWPSPAGCLSLPPPGHSHRTLLQVQVQQRRWWPIANLKNTIWVGTGSRFKDGPIYFCPFSPLLHFFSPSHQLWKLSSFLGSTCTSPSRLGIHCSAWGRHGRKATLHVYLKGERCRGQRLVDMRLVEGLLCPNVWEVARLGTWRMTAPLQLPPPPSPLSSPEVWVNLLLHFGG